MSYLARLKALIGEKGRPCDPAKPAKAPFDGFAGGGGSPFSPNLDALDLADAIEERVALAAGRVPPVFLDAWARLNCQKPFAVSEAEWRLALDDGGRFLDAWGCDAAELGWTPGELFDVMSGLVWRLNGQRAKAFN